MPIKRMFNKAIANFDVVLMLVIVTPIAVFNLLPEEWMGIELTTQTLLTLVLISLSAVASSQLRADPQDMHQKFESHEHKLSEIITHSKGRISAIRPDKNPHIWDGFKGNYFAINAPWLLEEESESSYEDLVKAHSARYLNPKFQKATYIFFTMGEQGKYFPKAIERFSNFATRLLEQEPIAADKIRVAVVDKPAPAFTLFIGTKETTSTNGKLDHSYAIYYINERPLMSTKGMPKWAFVSINDDFNTSLEDYAKDLANDVEHMSLKDFLDLKANTKKALDVLDFAASD